jgi:decaprenylphospho-beta-D-erythro-pentofuranosid-2-ulose 2-reductase
MTVSPAAPVAAGPVAAAPIAYASNRVVILGALSAVALAVARLYATERAALVLVARNADRLAAAAADLRARGAVKVETVSLDLDIEAASATSHVAAFAAMIGGIDHVHVVYGYLGDQHDASRDPAELAKILSVNFTSAALWCSAAGEFMRAQRRGAVVAISSVAGDRGRQSNFAYGAAKGGLALFMQGLAHSLAPVGARAVAIKLGFVDTPMTADIEKKGALWAKPEEVAIAIRRAAGHGGPIQYAPSFWKMIMLVIRTVPSFIFHRTKL